MTASPELVRALGSRYTIESEVARGGMANVYLAHDEAGGRVAIKVMRRELADALGLERFRREMAIVKSLAHPLIVPLLDSGDAGGMPWYAMPFVDGETLFQRLERERRLPLVQALGITRDVAAALGYAHGRGVLHRDIKPQNILLSGGRALVADFGLACAMGAADSRKLTQTGVIIGTVYYMSPEQLLESRELDQRTDVYALGCILFEMLTGAPPYVGRSFSEVVTRVLQAAVPSVRQVNETVPAAIEQALRQALSKPVEERYASMAEFVAALPP